MAFEARPDGRRPSFFIANVAADRRAPRVEIKFPLCRARRAKKIDAELEADRADDYSYTIERVYCTAAQKTSLIAPL